MPRWAWALVIPATTVLVLAFVLPLSLLFVSSFFAEGSFTWASYRDFFSSSASQRAYVRTVRIASIVTLAAIALGYPAAYAISRIAMRSRVVLIALVILPLMTNPVARTFSWLVILGREGLINNLLTVLGTDSVRLLYTEGAMIVGLLHLFIPLMMLPLISAFENIPHDVVPAAQSLGASQAQIFVRVLIPLTIEGLSIGATLVFTGCVTAYVTPAILGGSRRLMLSTLLHQRASTMLDWSGATVVAVVMFVTTLIAMVIIRRVFGLFRSPMELS
jgi:putative spermidine/putrescine transport system permease protein